VTATAVRIPVVGGHSESVNLTLSKSAELEEVRRVLSETSGVVVQDDIQNNDYPMPLQAHGKDDVFVGRLRKDTSQDNGLNLWIVADNLRKGAATNTVQIAEYLASAGLL
jgi:aspartate-semialdehyde dehydrogenase